MGTFSPGHCQRRMLILLRQVMQSKLYNLNRMALMNESGQGACVALHYGTNIFSQSVVH